jgi:hypothetical protein
LLGTAHLGNAQLKLFDRVLDAAIWQNTDTTYLILHEMLFRPISGTYDKGSLSSMGNKESRISVYNLNTAVLINRKDFGNRDSLTDACFLGVMDSKIWIYWYWYKSGLQAFNPITLEREVSMAQFYSRVQPPVGMLIDAFPEPLTSYYGYEPATQHLIVTNQNKQPYYVNVTSFLAKPTQPGINIVTRRYYFNTRASVNGINLQLDPSGNGAVYVENEAARKVVQANIDLLDVSFLMEQDAQRLYSYFNNLLIDEPQPANNSVAYKTKKSTADNLLALQHKQATDNVPILQQNNELLLTYRTGFNDDAVLGIAKIGLAPDGQLKILWKLPLEGMFYNLHTAQNTAAYKRLYEQNQPNPDFKYFYLLDNKNLLVIYLQYMAMVNTQTGKLLWMRKL